MNSYKSQLSNQGFPLLHVRIFTHFTHMGFVLLPHLDWINPCRTNLAPYVSHYNLCLNDKSFNILLNKNFYFK